MRDFLIVINSFIHDMATGVWIAVLIMMYVIHGQALDIRTIPQGSAFIQNLMDILWITSIVSLSVVGLTGIFRSLAFKFYGWTGDVARGRKRLLFYKHIMLGIFFGVGLYLQFMLKQII